MKDKKQRVETRMIVDFAIVLDIVVNYEFMKINVSKNDVLFAIKRELPFIPKKYNESN
jgi:hypothetical protein